MTVRSFLRDPQRPVVFLPVYFGYERIVEGSTYIGELSGKPKEKESVFGLLRTLPEASRALRQRARQPRRADLARRSCSIDTIPTGARVQRRGRRAPPWVNARGRRAGSAHHDAASTRRRRHADQPAGDDAARDAAPGAARSGSAAADRPVPRVAAQAVRTASRVTVTDARAPRRSSTTAIAMQLISREQHPLGDMVRMSEESAMLATYYRNNILHLFAMPSLLACAFVSNAALRTEDIQRLPGASILTSRPSCSCAGARMSCRGVVDERARLRWRKHGLHRGRSRARANGAGRRPTSAQAVQLSLLAQATIQTIERYYLAIALLLKAGSGQITQTALEQRCQLMAQRITMLYGFNSPEFFDRSLFEQFIDLLRARGVIRASREGQARIRRRAGRASPTTRSSC